MHSKKIAAPVLPAHLRAATLLISMLVAMCFQSFSVYAQENAGLKAVGQIALTKGVVTARSAQRELTSLAKGSPVYLGDIIETASRSFTVIQFDDGGKITLRPESRFDINEYDETAGQEKQSFELLKGGLRAVTGAIGKARPESVNYTARNTTIGIRGTTFVVKLCDEGTPGCDYISNNSEESAAVSDSKFVDIFVVDKTGGQKRKITRKELRELLVGVYVSVIDGGVRVTTDAWYIDMGAGDKCSIAYSDGGVGGVQSQDEVECFVNTGGLEAIDVFIGEDAEKIAIFNLFDGNEVFVGNELCEIN